MQSIFTTEAHKEILNRFENLKETATPQWGKMSIGQMAHHCQGPLNIILQKKDYDLKPNWLIRILFKKSLFNDIPYRKNLPTTPAFKITDPKDFNTEKVELVSLIKELHQFKDKEEWQAHSVFGKFNKQ